MNEWDKIKDSNGITILKKFYADQEKYSFPFQMMAYISRLNILKNTIKMIDQDKTDTKYILITERCLYTDKFVFAKMLHDQGKIEDVCYKIYMNWFDEFTNEFSISYSIYVKTDPNICYNRINKRARDGEEIIALSYLNECNNYHEEFMSETNKFKGNKLTLCGNVDIYENKSIIKEWLNKIHDFIQS